MTAAIPSDEEQEAIARAAEDKFAALRGRAMQAYATLEQSLFKLFAALTGLEYGLAAAVFFKISPPRQVLKLLQELLQKKHGETYLKFWKSLQGHISNSTDTRNPIVHWNVALSVTSDGTRDYMLIPADYMSGRNLHPIYASSIQDFTDKCEFLFRLCSMFRSFAVPDAPMLTHMGTEQLQAWRGIFEQEVVYPPPSTHPQYQKPPEPENQPPPSRESPQPP
jgi:hypothetical protein